MFRRATRPARRATQKSHEQLQAEEIAELTKSRRAVADAYEIERQRIERDLHDGTQQYLVAAAMKIGEAQLEATGQVQALLQEAMQDLHHGLDALRATVHGISPQVLYERGLIAAIDDIAAIYGPHVEVRCPHPLPTLSPSVLAAAYFFVTEALTNAAKYAPNAPVSVLVMADAHLSISVVDAGPGGAVLIDERGLAGMQDRLAAFGGRLTLSSPPGGPTRVNASIPLLLDRGNTGLGEHV
ncbi:sensor histidine kinase [Corynebacterium sp. S7]